VAGAGRGIDHPGEHEVQDEKSGAASHLECGAVGPSLPTGDVFEAVTCVVDAPLIKRNRPFLVVRLRFPVVIQNVGQLGV
jgi:hypothetical protein